jgi:DNA (cytosine-5)-methyltransferase 1
MPASPEFTFVDLFAGIGGCRMGFERAGGECVFTSEWDDYAQQTYKANFRVDEDHPFGGDITEVDASVIPDHDVLVGGFPCQPFSLAGVSKKTSLGRPHGFKDPTQGTLFFDVARIIEKKRPKAFVLENVRNLISHDGGNTFRVIRHRLETELGYEFHARVIDASAVVPQGRRRIFIVGFDKDKYVDGTTFDFDGLDLGTSFPRLSSVLHRSGVTPVEEPYTDEYGAAAAKYTLSDGLWTYLQNYKTKHNAAGNGFGFGLVGPDDVARTLSARYYKDGSEILVDQGGSLNPRRLTPRECARIMGFPDSFKIPVSDSRAYRQFGNSVVVPVVEAVAGQVAPWLTTGHHNRAVIAG